GRDVSALPYYRAFNRFKLTCILHGVYARYRRGQKTIDPDELEEMRQRTFGLIESAAADAEHL
ncbi:MAG: phosphotransferase family protein, partial [Actinobacteria bacterium]|nr:phosphotransferase family protein [Actinomycetota bacterium]